jgi:hypothetical protein
MKTLWSCTAVAVLCLAPPARAEDAPKKEPQSFQIPFRLTVPKHVLVRAKINGKGPFNFILDTGAPALFVSEELCKKLGIKADKKGWGTFDRFEIEGGLVLEKATGRIETPFQLEGMNGLGLAGAELHGIIGYNVLARYRMEIDFTRDKMTWTELVDFVPPEPKGMGGKGGSRGSLEIMGTFMKLLGSFMGMKANPDVAPRGFLGVELTDGDEYPVVKAVLAKSPAGEAGVKAGDRLTHVQGRGVQNAEDVARLLKKLTAGDKIKLTVVRGKETMDITFKAGEGL